jgi:hypothetical protein
VDTPTHEGAIVDVVDIDDDEIVEDASKLELDDSVDEIDDFTKAELELEEVSDENDNWLELLDAVEAVDDRATLELDEAVDETSTLELNEGTSEVAEEWVEDNARVEKVEETVLELDKETKTVEDGLWVDILWAEVLWIDFLCVDVLPTPVSEVCLDGDWWGFPFEDLLALQAPNLGWQPWPQ